jgi:hypothetical protein
MPPLLPRGAGGYRYGGVLLLTLAVAIFALLAPDGRGARTIELFAAGATLLVAVLTSKAPEATRRAASIGLGLGVGVAGTAAALGFTNIAVSLALIALIAIVTIGIILAGLVRLIVERGVVLQAVLAAICVYVLVGLTFGFVIGAVAEAGSAPYFASGTDGTQSERVYYSFTVLTTTGFGDFTAGLRGGQALAVLEMLLGQLYLVTVIALLVGNLRRRTQ